MAQLVRAPARRAADPGSNPGPGENFSLKLLKQHFNSNVISFIITEDIFKSYLKLYIAGN